MKGIVSSNHLGYSRLLGPGQLHLLLLFICPGLVQSNPCLRMKQADLSDSVGFLEDTVVAECHCVFYPILDAD